LDLWILVRIRVPQPDAMKNGKSKITKQASRALLLWRTQLVCALIIRTTPVSMKCRKTMQAVREEKEGARHP
jgi:hypothetical protein